jgi:hypothetical protein
LFLKPCERLCSLDLNMAPLAHPERRGHSPVTNVDTLTEVGMERSEGRDQNKLAFANQAVGICQSGTERRACGDRFRGARHRGSLQEDWLFCAKRAPRVLHLRRVRH